jgi:predicted Zn finger-like uncharacterized protein
MNVSCAICEALYRVNPVLVPHQGVRARCATCGAVLQVLEVGGGSPVVPVAPRVSLAPVVPAFDVGRARTFGAPQLSIAILESDPEAAPDGFAEAPVELLRSKASLTPVEPIPPVFRPPPAPIIHDVAARARRLARALVSDMVTYRSVDRAQGLRDGTLVARFRDEIERSRAEYVRMVGVDVAAASTHFEDALNELLADGAKLF